MNVFNRSVTVNVSVLDEERVVANSVFIDSYHEFVLNLTVDAKRFIVLDAEGQINRCPFQECASIVTKVKKLIGLDLSHSVTKQVKYAVGGESGCTHFTELTLECVKGIRQANYRISEMKMPIKDVHANYDNLLKGTCFHYR